MKSSEQLTSEGLNLLAFSSGQPNKIKSYIAKRRGRRVYGWFDDKLNKYVETPA